MGNKITDNRVPIVLTKIAYANPGANNIEKILIQRNYKNAVTFRETERYGTSCHILMNVLGYLCMRKKPPD